jgi:integrase
MSKVARKVIYGEWGQGTLYLYEGNPIWQSVLSVNSKQVEMSTRTNDLRKARAFHRAQLEKKVLDQHGKGPFQTPAHTRLTVGKLLDDLVADYELRRVKNLQGLLSYVKSVREYLGETRAISIKPQLLTEFVKARRAENYSDGTINNMLTVLASALKLGYERGLVPTLAPIKKLPGSPARTGFFERSEINSVIGHLPAYAKDLVRMGYLTGWRYGELVTLRWTDVDLDAKLIRLRAEESKNSHGRVIAVEGELLELLHRRQADRLLPTLLDRVKLAPTVFHRKGKPIGRIDRSWETACKKAGVPGRLFHDLRRTAVRNMVRAGVPEAVAMKISGHRDRSTFDRYNIVAEGDLRQAAQRLQLYVDTLPTKRA